MAVFRIYLENVLPYSTMDNKTVETFGTKSEALDSFFFNDKKDVIIHIDKEAYKVSKYSHGQFFQLYVWVSGRGWKPRLVNVDKAIIKTFLGVEK